MHRLRPDWAGMPTLPISQGQGGVKQLADLFLRVDVGWFRRSATGAEALARYEGAWTTLRQKTAEATQQVVSRTTGVRARVVQGASHALASALSIVPDGSGLCLVSRSSARSCVRVVLLAVALASSVATKSAKSAATGPEKWFVVMTPPPDLAPPSGGPRRGAWCR